ncbi:hypothetical protein V1517DRAFT_318520 [Lipomyces orientalis]|uniref:Uncharacterized protein n=1 Tax=Lipomyces orientalis TaxID=1233043 RepID=A0ACC3TS88_9ASCO
MAILVLNQICLVAFLNFVASLFLHAGGSCRRKRKVSEIFLKQRYSTESLLSDALSAKYKVSITSDSLVSSYSYQNSPYDPSVLVRIRPPGQKRTVFYGWALIILNYAMIGGQAIIGYVYDKMSFLSTSVLCVTASFLAVRIFSVITTTAMKSSFKEDDAACATVYFNTTDENWAASALFNSSERMEIAMKLTKEVWLLTVQMLAVLIWGPLALNEWHGHSKESLPEIMTMVSTAMSVLFQFFSVAILVAVIRRSASSLKVQFAHPVNEKDAGNAEAVKFDARKVVRKFADDIGKAFPNSRKEWPADAGVYYDFAIAGKDGGLVYGRMSFSR